jgi:hypothetical protein
VQVQYQESVLWELYEETVRTILKGHLERLSALELEAAWLRTHPGFDWIWDNRETEDPTPVCLDDVLEDAIQMLYARAADWSNQRIRNYLDTSATFD